MGATSTRVGWEKIPLDYFRKVKQAQKALNERVESVRLPHGEVVTKEAAEDFIAGQAEREADQRKLTALRDLAAKIRSDGYGAGYADDVYEPDSDIEVRINLCSPYPKDTGARECWIRGYCQGRSRKTIVNPKDYL